MLLCLIALFLFSTKEERSLSELGGNSKKDSRKVPAIAIDINQEGFASYPSRCPIGRSESISPPRYQITG
jgi:predicted Zn-ribbon and HTH transcriptional regulator